MMYEPHTGLKIHSGLVNISTNQSSLWPMVVYRRFYRILSAKDDDGRRRHKRMRETDDDGLYKLHQRTQTMRMLQCCEGLNQHC